MARYTKLSGFSDKLSQERITIRLHVLKKVQEAMSKQCLTELKNDYNVRYFRLAEVETKVGPRWLITWPEDLTRDTREIKNLKATFRAVFSAQIEKCARNFRPHRFSATLRKSEPFWVGWNNEWQDAQRPGQSRRPGFKIEEELERIFKDMEIHLSEVFNEMTRVEMEAIVDKTAPEKIMEPSEDIKFKVIQGKLAMDCRWRGKIRRDILCRFEEEKDDATESELGADDAAAQLINEANQPGENGVRPSEKEVKVYRTVLRESIAALETSKYRLPNKPYLTFTELEEGELDWVEKYKRRLQTKYRRILKDLTRLIRDGFFESPDHSTFWTYVKDWSDIFEDTRRVYTPGPLERVENIHHLQRKLRKLDRHMSTFLTSYYNEHFTRKFRDLCSVELEKKRLPDNIMWFQVRLRESFEEDKHNEYHLHIATHLPKAPEESMVWDRRWKDIVKNYNNPNYDFDPEGDGDIEPVNIDELPHMFNAICTIKKDGKMTHETLMEEEEPKEDEVIEIAADEDAPQAVVPEGGKRKRGRPRKEEAAAKRQRLSKSGRDEALLDEFPRGRAPPRSDDAREMAYHHRRQRALSASSVLTQLADDIVEALNPANDNDAHIVIDSGVASSSTQASNSNGANKNAAGPSRKRQNAGMDGFSGDGGDERERKRPKKKELPVDKNADSEDQPSPKDKGKGKEVDPIVPVKKKRGRPPGVKNKPKVPVAPNPVVNGNSTTVTLPELHSGGQTRPGYQPPRNPVPGPDDISDNTVLISSHAQLNSSSFRMDRPLPSGVNIPERPRYLTPAPLPPLINPSGAIFPNNQELWRDTGYPNTFGQPRQGQQEQQLRQQHPGNQSLQAPQRPRTPISPSNAGNNSSVPPHAGTALNPIVIDEQRPSSSRRPTTNSPHPRAPNLSRADRSQASLPKIIPPQSSVPQLKQEDQQQSMNPNSPHHGLVRPPPAAPSYSSRSNTVPPNWGLPPPSGQHQQQTMHTNSPRQGIARPSPVAQPQTDQPRITPPHLGSRQPRGPSQSPRPRLAHAQPMHPQIHNTSGPLGNSHNQFQTGRGQPLPSSMPPPQGSSLRHEAFPSAHIQTHAGPSDMDPALRRIMVQQEAGGISQAQLMMQQQLPSPRVVPHGHLLQQGGVGSPQPYSQSPPHGHFRGSTYQEYYGQQNQYNTQYYAQQGKISQNTFTTGQEQSQHYASYQQGSPFQDGIRHPPPSPPQAAYAQDLPSCHPPSPYHTTPQFPPQQFHPSQVETPALQYSTAAQNRPGLYHPSPQNQLIRQSPIQQQRGIQEPTPPMSRNTSRDFLIPRPETNGEQRSYADAVWATMPRHAEDPDWK
jgi:hypothetical protein